MLRGRRRLTQLQLASRQDVSVSYISTVENEHLRFGDDSSENYIRTLALALDVNIGRIATARRQSFSQSANSLATRVFHCNRKAIWPQL